MLENAASWSSIEEDITESVTWGDVDGDGDLDLAVGNGGANRVYLNIDGVLETSASWSSIEEDYTSSVMWGDVDGDGDLDLAVGNSTFTGGGNQLYLNQGGTLETSASWLSLEEDATESVAWGDVDGDGDLDLAVGNGGANRVYLNIDGVLETSASWSSIEEDYTNSVMWGDVDGDGDLDLAVGNGGANRVYLNIDGVLETSASWSSIEEDYTSSVMWGDVDGDGDLDLAAGNEGSSGSNGLANRIYLNEDQSLETSASWSSFESDRTTSVAWGDVDGDGDLDLAAGARGLNRIYLNHSRVLSSLTNWSSASDDRFRNPSWADIDGDGDFDLAANSADSYYIFLNQRGKLETTASQTFTNDTSEGIMAWGDVDGDGDLDLAIVGWMSFIYLNDGGVLETSPSRTLDTGNPSVTSAVWGDIDGDGDLDLVVGYAGRGHSGSQDRIFINNNGTLESASNWSPSYGFTSSLDWGDVDRDGDLDLAVGINSANSNLIYLNQNGVLESSPSWSSGEKEYTRSVAWGDIDSDGDLDLAVGNSDTPIRVYTNHDGSLETWASWSSNEDGNGANVTWVDIDGDGDLDLASNADIYVNQGGVLDNSAIQILSEAESGYGTAWGDVDGDGDFDLAVGSERLTIYENRSVTRQRSSVSIAPISSSASTWTGETSVALAPTDGYAVAHVRESAVIPIQYHLYDVNGSLVNVRGYFSLGGGGHWQEAVSTTTTDTSELSTRPFALGPDESNEHVFEWDVLASGVFGQSDSVIFRLEVLPSFKSLPNQTAGPYMYQPVSTQSYPFRVRGYQVQVMVDESSPQPTSANDAVVFRLPVNQVDGAEPIGGFNLPYVSNQNGYLQGRGEIQPGDQLVALAPITQTQSYALFHTSAAVTEEGIVPHVVDGSTGVQELSVSSSNPLMLFNLDVALEWDARRDEEFLTTLERDLRRTSQLLYDLSEGQIALGHTRIFHDAKHLPMLESENESEDGWQPWIDAHIRVYASNRLRPNAALGGVTSQPFSEPGNEDLLYTPGQIHIGSVWNRYGESTGNLGEDWPRVLAHELGHYLLYLDDNYIGLNDEGVLVTVESCPGIMANPYREDYSEFHPEEGWSAGCSQTLSQREFGRSDWETIRLRYPWLNPLTGAYRNNGPSRLPLAVTQIESYSVDDLNFDLSAESDQVMTVVSGTVPLTPTLDVPIFYLNEGNTSIQVGQRARAFLLQDDWLVDLGRPNFGEVVAHGVRPGDRLCVVELEANRSGCEDVTSSDNQLELHTFASSEWQPEIRVSPEGERTIALDVIGVPVNLTLRARHYPKNGPR